MVTQLPYLAYHILDQLIASVILIFIHWYFWLCYYAWASFVLVITHMTDINKQVSTIPIFK